MKINLFSLKHRLIFSAITQGLLRPDAERLRPLRELPIPQNKTSLRRVLGLFPHYSQWIPILSKRLYFCTNCFYPDLY